MKYVKQLDSLRALAIFTVIVVHWFPEGNWLYSFSVYANAPKIFFTISGFLITSILLKEKNRAEISGSNKILVFKNFFFKRALRIFPAYFLVLTIWFFTRPSTEPISFRYFATFTANIYIYQTQIWPALAHLWSMSVEEQFYFFWPWIILLARRRYLFTIIICAVLTGLISQFIFTKNFADVLTFSCMDALGMGALLAWVAINKPHLINRYKNQIRFVAIGSFMLLIIQALFTKPHILLSTSTLIVVMTIGIIAFFLGKHDEKKYFFSFLFEGKLLMQFGKMSYGIYLYHFLIPYYTYSTFPALMRFLNITTVLKKGNYIWMFENFIILIIVSVISYRFFEIPFLKLKKYFSNSQPSTQPVAIN